MKFDLHIHTNYSDGLYSPKEIVDLAITKNLNGIAITDHDTIEGIEVALKYTNNRFNLKIIPGIELSCIYNYEEVHILGYFIDYTHPKLLNISKTIRNSRGERGAKMVEKLNNLGLSISLKEVRQLSKYDYIGRPHIARVLINKGYVKDISEAFHKYLAIGKPAYVDRYRISIEETISLINNAGGLAVLAHPGLLKDKNIINYCISSGIQGLECIHSKHSEDDKIYLLDIAEKNNLVVTGGSDFHGDIANGESTLGKHFVGIDNILQMKERI